MFMEILKNTYYFMVGYFYTLWYFLPITLPAIVIIALYWIKRKEQGKYAQFLKVLVILSIFALLYVFYGYWSFSTTTDRS